MTSSRGITRAAREARRGRHRPDAREERRTAADRPDLERRDHGRGEPLDARAAEVEADELGDVGLDLELVARGLGRGELGGAEAEARHARHGLAERVERTRDVDELLAEQPENKKRDRHRSTPAAHCHYGGGEGADISAHAAAATAACADVPQTPLVVEFMTRVQKAT